MLDWRLPFMRRESGKLDAGPNRKVYRKGRGKRMHLDAANNRAAKAAPAANVKACGIGGQMKLVHPTLLDKFQRKLVTDHFH